MGDLEFVTATGHLKMTPRPTRHPQGDGRARSTPVFPAGNRFLHLSALIRSLHTDWLVRGDELLRDQINNLRRRLTLTVRDNVPYAGQARRFMRLQVGK